MKLRQAEQALQSVPPFSEPKLELEQYATSAQMAALMFHTINETFDDLREKAVLDLGVGTGMLSSAALLYGAAYVLGVDIDESALAQAGESVSAVCSSRAMEFDGAFDRALGSAECVVAALRIGAFDTVVMNPPFGTKATKGADMRFVELAASLQPAAIYSLHKSSTREHVLRKARSWGYEGAVVAELRWELKATYGFHKKKSVDIEVDLVRFVPAAGEAGL